MGSVITWIDITARYPEFDKLPSGTSPEIQDNLIAFAEASVHSRLAGSFGVPFSSNNYTARDLVVDTLFVQNMMSRQPEKAKAVQEYVGERIKAVLLGQAQMVTSAGSAAITMVGDTAWSSTMNYPPTFGVSDTELVHVSSSQLTAEAAARGEY